MSDARTFSADALRALGRNARALEVYRQALEHAGDDEELAESIQEKIGELEGVES